ncbi:MAG: Rrf2 family transcriptional regulator [Proteobacteria bacterium]|nr:MAG: Rrf2 family transcriptional regulator [Pseudomonadota bacterium]
MQLRNQVEWALHCCTILGSLRDDERVSTKALAEFHGVPKEYLSKALQALAQADLVSGTLGPKGGYRLTRTPDKITFLEIVEAIEGRKRTFRCEEIRGNNPCIKSKAQKPTGVCGIAKVMYRADEAWRDQLRAMTLADTLEELGTVIGPEMLEKSGDWLRSR